MSRYRDLQRAHPDIWIMPPPGDVESMADFLDDHPDWSPMLDDEGMVRGLRCGWATAELVNMPEPPKKLSPEEFIEGLKRIEEQSRKPEQENE